MLLSVAMTRDGSLLVIEDEHGPAESLRVIFKERCDVVIATSLVMGLRILRERAVDAVTLDLQLAVPTQGQTLYRLLTLDRNLSVFLITGLPQNSGLVRQAMALGAHYVGKPFDIEHLRSIVLTAVDRHRSRQNTDTGWIAPWIREFQIQVDALRKNVERLRGLQGRSGDIRLTEEALSCLQANARALQEILAKGPTAVASRPARADSSHT